MLAIKSLFVSSALALSCMAVAAGEVENFVRAQDGATNCWSRTYTAEHLRNHPHQQVTAMNFTVTYMGETEWHTGQYVFRMEAALRDGTRGYTIGPCLDRDGRAWCGVECDGGGVYISQRNGGDILVDLASTGGIAMSTSCGEEEGWEGFSLTPGRDDKTFLLHAQPAQICEPATY